MSIYFILESAEELRVMKREGKKKNTISLAKKIGAALTALRSQISLAPALLDYSSTQPAYIFCFPKCQTRVGRHVCLR